ncbi:hypothetical protein CISIN_1g0168642mg, partial [Citrus sinensis]
LFRLSKRCDSHKN